MLLKNIEFKIFSFLLSCNFILLSACVLADTGTNKSTNSTSTVAESNAPWMQTFHTKISNSVYQSAKWFDDFFIVDGNDAEDPKARARIRLGWRPKSGDWSELETRFKLRVRLPKLKHKASLVFSDEEDDEHSDLPLETTSTYQDEKDESFTAAIRLIFGPDDKNLLDTRVGLSGGDIFARARHKRQLIFTDKQAFTIQPSLYYYLDDGLGAKLLLEYDYQLDHANQFRVNYSIRGSEAFHGIRWKHGFYQLSQINDKTASITGLQVEGERNGEEGFTIDKYTLSYRYRFNAVRHWIYFEVEPFLEWEEEESYDTTPGIALRIEGFFEKQQ